MLTHYLKGMTWCDRCQQAGRSNRLIYTEARGSNGNHFAYFVCRGRQKGECDLPHLPAALVERAVEAEYAGLRTTDEFGAALLAELDQTLAHQEETTRTLHTTLRKQLAKLNIQEDRLLELAADGELPQSRIRARLNSVALDRKSIEESLGKTGAELAVGADVLRTAVELTRDPERLYMAAPDKARRALNETFFEAFYVDEFGHATRSVRRTPFDDLSSAEATYLRRRNMGARDRMNEQRRPLRDRLRR